MDGEFSFGTGRPPKYRSVKELQDKIIEYFQEGVKKKEVIIGPSTNRQKVTIEVPTITGLSLYLGFCSRQSFYDYEKKPEFSYTIKKAAGFIETHYEEMLQQGNQTGAIFALKNFGWEDKQINEVNDKSISHLFPTDEEIEQAAKEKDSE